MKKGFDYKKVTNLELECDCTSISKRKWDSYMADAKRANKFEVNRLVKILLPELYYQLALEFPNPYNYYRTPSHLILIHSGIEYFLKYK